MRTLSEKSNLQDQRTSIWSNTNVLRNLFIEKITQDVQDQNCCQCFLTSFFKHRFYWDEKVLFRATFRPPVIYKIYSYCNMYHNVGWCPRDSIKITNAAKPNICKNPQPPYQDVSQIYEEGSLIVYGFHDKKGAASYLGGPKCLV